MLTLIGALILLPVLAWSLSYQLQSGATVPSRATAPTEPVEYQLAFLNSNGAAARDDVSVFRFRYLLDSIHRKTGESYTALADATVTTQQACHSRYGRDVKLLDLMEAGNKAVQLPGGPASYGEALAAILVVSCSE